MRRHCENEKKKSTCDQKRRPEHNKNSRETIHAVAAALFGQRRYLLSFSVVGASLVLPAAFSAFLISSGLPPLPNSVLAKTIGSGNGSTSSSSFLHVAEAAFQKIGLGRGQMAWKVNIALALALLITLLSAKSWPHRWLLLGSVGAIILHICFGQTGWFLDIPADWTPIALMQLSGERITPAENKVLFLSTGEGTRMKSEKNLKNSPQHCRQALR